MLTDMMDHPKSIINKLTPQGKVDPGDFSFMEPGWWILHAAAISGVYLLGHRLHNR